MCSEIERVGMPVSSGLEVDNGCSSLSGKGMLAAATGLGACGSEPDAAVTATSGDFGCAGLTSTVSNGLVLSAACSVEGLGVAAAASLAACRSCLD